MSFDPGSDGTALNSIPVNVRRKPNRIARFPNFSLRKQAIESCSRAVRQLLAASSYQALTDGYSGDLDRGSRRLVSQNTSDTNVERDLQR